MLEAETQARPLAQRWPTVDWAFFTYYQYFLKSPLSCPQANLMVAIL